MFVTIDALDPERREALARKVSKLARQVRVPGVRDPASDMFASLLENAGGTRVLLPWAVTAMARHPLRDVAVKLWKRVVPSHATHVALFAPCDPDDAFDASIKTGKNLHLTLEDFRAIAPGDEERFERLARETFGAHDLRVTITNDPEEAYRAVDLALAA